MCEAEAQVSKPYSEDTRRNDQQRVVSASRVKGHAEIFTVAEIRHHDYPIGAVLQLRVRLSLHPHFESRECLTHGVALLRDRLPGVVARMVRAS